MATFGTIGCTMSIQVDITIREDLHIINKHVMAMSPKLCDCVRVASKGATEAVVKVAAPVLKGAVGNSLLTQGTTKIGTVIINSFKIGYSVTLSATSTGLVSAIALGVNAIIECPLLTHNLYKIHRNRKFSAISRTEMIRQSTVECITSGSTVALGIGGAVLGQIAIPVPGVGAAAGGFVGTVAGKGLGYLTGRGIALFITEKEVDLSPVIHCTFVPVKE